MADRDIPSVPVTTLAGLTSLSDLLNELPIAESTQQTLNKSLLFHPRVVEEANNLLAVRDDQLAQQLINALRQTNADNIELRDEYTQIDAICDNTAPTLLQTVNEYDTNVFQYHRLHQETFPALRQQNLVNDDNYMFVGQESQTHRTPVSNNEAQYSQPAVKLQQQQSQKQPQIFSPAAMIQNDHASASTNMLFTQEPNTSDNNHYMQSNNLGQHNLTPQSQATFQQVAQKPPRNNEFLQQPQQKPSPTQGSTAPETSQINQQMPIKHTMSHINAAQHNKVSAAAATAGGSTVGMLEALKNSATLIQKAEETSVKVNAPVPVQPKQKEITNEEIDIDQVDSKLKLKMPVISLKAISTEDSALLQNDLKSFIKNEPEKAAQMGVSTSDAFTRIKAEESRFTKRRPTESLEQIISKPKLRRVEKKLAPVVQKLSPEELMKTSNYQRFIQLMQQVLNELDETEAVVSLEDDDNPECISTQLLQSISNEAQKLKARNAIDALPENKLTLLISFAMRSMTVAKNLSCGPDVQDDIDDDGIMKILNAAEAALLVCNIYTCKDTKFLQEDNIDTIIKFVQFQLRETIFPCYDPVYTFETKKKIEKKKSKHKTQQQQKETSQLYHKLVEVTKVLVQMYNKFHFVDTITIHASALGVEPFFVDNIETLQFVCLDLVTSIFQNEKYAAHRKNILAEILTSVDRLPHSKRNLRPFKLTNNGGNIQMMTALVLQLIQCSVVLPLNFCETVTGNSSKKVTTVNQDIDKDSYIHAKYETAVSIGGNFLTTFLNKCKSKSGETDFRPLFENFIHDLLTTVNRPEWPASELLLSLLGRLLVKYMADKNIDQSIRVVSLEYLGIVAAKLRKDTVESRCRLDTIDQMIKMIKEEQQREGDDVQMNSQLVLDAEEERTEFLQRILLDYLAVNEQEDNITWSHAKHFYLASWYRDILKLKRQVREGGRNYASRKKHKRRAASSGDESENGMSVSDNEDNGAMHPKDEELQRQIFLTLELRKKFLLSKIGHTQSSIELDDIKTYLDYNNAHLIAQYLAGKRQFSQSFDIYLQKIILVVREPSIAIRTKAMKCLSSIVEVDQSILARKDMQLGVAQKLLDTAISVREAAVDLIGKYILSDIELVDQYYDMLSQRILDTGVSVRKRVIKILRDICIEFPTHDKIPDICVKMIRRVNDEEGIQKLVVDVFMTMWFAPNSSNSKDAMERRVNQIIDVVCSASEKSSCGLDDLLKIIFEPKENKDDVKAKKEIPKSTIKACQQIVDGLVSATMNLESSQNQNKLVGCITALHLFAKVQPKLLVNHAETLEPYLNVKTNSSNLVQFISCIAEILEQVVPLMDHPSESFLNSLEAHLMMLVFSNTQLTITSCVSSLASIVNRITKNYNLIRDCFKKFYYKSLLPSRRKLEEDSSFPLVKILNPAFRRSIFTVGLLMRHFDFKNSIVYGAGTDDALPPNICNEVFETFAFFFKCDNIDLRRQTLVALGHFCVQNYEFLTKSELRDAYLFLLSQVGVQNDIKVQVLKNILIYLTEEEQIMVRRDKDWHTQSKTEDLKEMGDVSSGMASAIIQVYLSEILHCFLHRVYQVRFWAMRVIEIVLRQGLIHPIKIVPYLICLSTDSEKEVAHSADRHLQDIDKQYPGFVNMKSYDGLHLSYTLQSVLQRTPTNCIVRGFRIKEKGEPPSALNGFLYSLLRNTKPTRRALIQSIIKQFDEQKISLHQMLYLADNLAYFPYVVQDEPLYLVHQIDLLISNTGTNLLCNFREGLKPSASMQNKTGTPTDLLMDEDDEEDLEALFERLPDETTELEKCITAAQGCMLLLILKQQLKDNYGITDSKIQRYTPSDTTKLYDKAVQRRTNAIFSPKATINVLKEQRNSKEPLDDEGKRELISRYLEFKQLMLKLDPVDSGSEAEDRPIHSKENSQIKPTVHIPSIPVTDFEANIPITTVEMDNNVTASKQSRNTQSKSTKKGVQNKKRRKRKASTSDEENDYSDEYN